MKGCRPLTDQEVAEILAVVDRNRHAKRDRALLVLGIKTGFRIAELLSLRIGDVWNGEKVVDRVTVRRANMKKKVEGRTVVLHKDAKDAVGDLLGHLIDQELLATETFLFRSQKGGNKAITTTQAWEIVHRAAREAGVDGTVGTHSMRKTFAATVYQRLGRNLYLVQQAMGHKDPKSTASYLSFDQKEIDEAILG